MAIVNGETAALFNDTALIIQLTKLREARMKTNTFRIKFLYLVQSVFCFPCWTSISLRGKALICVSAVAGVGLPPPPPIWEAVDVFIPRLFRVYPEVFLLG